MSDHIPILRFLYVANLAARSCCRLVLAGIVLSTVSFKAAAAEPAQSKLIILPPSNSRGAAFEKDLSKNRVQARKPGRKTNVARPSKTSTSAAQLKRPRTGVRHVNLQQAPSDAVPRKSPGPELATNPCAAMDEKPLETLGIGIAQPQGELPNDYATACWEQLNTTAGPLAAMRFWPTFAYNWDATRLCHRPLYFEQINLERHGYGCCESLQPLASAAHFFATVPALPYCMAVECPGECVYTLGHYRPGSCPPWRHHWPPCSPLAAAAEGGVWTGMIFLIP